VLQNAFYILNHSFVAVLIRKLDIAVLQLSEVFM